MILSDLSLYEGKNIDEMFNSLVSLMKFSAETEDQFNEYASKNYNILFRLKSNYSDAMSVKLNVTFIKNVDDKYLKSFQFIKTFGNNYEVRMTNFKTNSIPFIVSSIDKIENMGTLGIYFNNKDTEGLLDPTIITGSVLLKLGMGLCYSLKVKKISLGDEATIKCGGNEETSLHLSTMMKLKGGLGYYERAGFKYKGDMDILVDFIRNTTISDLMLVDKKGLLESFVALNGSMKVQEYVANISGETMEKSDRCKEFSTFITTYKSVKICNVPEHLMPLCNVLNEYNTMYNSQTAILNANHVLLLI